MHHLVFVLFCFLEVDGKISEFLQVLNLHSYIIADPLHVLLYDSIIHFADLTLKHLRPVLRNQRRLENCAESLRFFRISHFVTVLLPRLKVEQGADADVHILH